MKHPLAILGAAALLAWTGLGLFAWSNVAGRVTVTFSDEPAVDARTSETLALTDEVGALHQDVRALANALGENLQTLRDDLVARQDEHAADLQRRFDALRDEVGSRSPSSPSSDVLADLLRELRAGRAADASSESAPAAQPIPSDVASVASAPAAPAPAEAPRPRTSFLAFELPSDDFRFDERRSWAVLPALSRVGFDGKTTLHDFSGTTSAIAGELEIDLARPAESPHLALRVEAKALATGDDGRDEAMREHLAVAEHPGIEFELTRFAPDDLDVAHERGTGRAHGRMTIRGVTREVEMAVRYSLDDARRLQVEGEMPLELPRFEVPVPNKLGLITMRDEVKVWISLRLRANPRHQG